MENFGKTLLDKPAVAPCGEKCGLDNSRRQTASGVFALTGRRQFAFGYFQTLHFLELSLPRKHTGKGAGMAALPRNFFDH